MEFPPCCQPNGRINNGCAANVHRQRVEGHYQLSGAWTGWKIQGNKLIGPQGLRFTPQTLANAWRQWSEPDVMREPPNAVGIANNERRQHERIEPPETTAQESITRRTLRLQPIAGNVSG